MPCYDYQSSPDGQKDDNEKRYGIRATNEGMARSVACELGRVIMQERGLHKELSQLAKKWLYDHRLEDERRKDVQGSNEPHL